MRRPKVSLLHGRCCNFAWFRMEPSLVPLGSMLHEVYYLQHFGLVPAWFHVVPAARSVVFTAHEVGSATKSIDFAWEGLKFCLVPPLVPLGSTWFHVAKSVLFTTFWLGSCLVPRGSSC